jgi:hypothetical protein
METILCAAIWFKDLPTLVDDIPSNLLRPTNCDRGIVFCGHRHPHCLYQMIALTGKYSHTVGESIQGFLTNLNRFVDRREAFDIAESANQLNDRNRFNDRTLFSEDLY